MTSAYLLGNRRPQRQWRRREFLKSATALTGEAGLTGYMSLACAEPAPETTKIRLFEADGFGTCVAPQYIAQELLKLEGFTEARYIKYPSETQLEQHELLVAGQIDISLAFPPHDVTSIDSGAPLVILAGSHSGC